MAGGILRKVIVKLTPVCKISKISWPMPTGDWRENESKLRRERGATGLIKSGYYML